MNEALKLPWTGERFLPGMRGQIELEHVHRYALALALARGKVVADVACGEGYGSALLGSVAQRVFGVDISPEAVAHARMAYPRDNVEYRVGDCAAIPLPDRSVDLVVSFETIEHHARHAEMLAEFKRILKPDGTLMISSPNKEEYSDIPHYQNPYHVKELYLDEFLALLRAHFRNLRLSGQRVLRGSIVVPFDGHADGFQHIPSPRRPEAASGDLVRKLYFLAVASDEALPGSAISVLEAEDDAYAAPGADRERTEIKIYAQTEAQGFSETLAIGEMVEVDGAARAVRLPVPGAQDERLTGIRLDPGSGPVALHIHDLWLDDAAGQTLWHWDGGVAAFQGGSQLVTAEGVFPGAPVSLFAIGSDAWCNLVVPQDALAGAACGRLCLSLTAQELSRGLAIAQLSERRRRGDAPEAAGGAPAAGRHSPGAVLLQRVRGLDERVRNRVRSSALGRRAVAGLRAVKPLYRVLARLRSRLLNEVVEEETRELVREDAAPSGAMAASFGRDLRYVEYDPVQQRPATPVRLIAFYLPQFHPIPENDQWWGKGFTEWTNVTRAVPQFEGHYQPHLPGELGFYDLRVPEILRRQAALATEYGLGGFCFYFYWFGGKTLLEAPLAQFLADPELKLPFCVCWANENWTRRWDGREGLTLIAQQHSAEDDIGFIAHLAHYLRDERYIRVNGKPLIVVYRPGLLPDARATAGRWREWCRANGIGEIHLAYTHSFDSGSPAQFGFDAAIEFPPNNSHPPVITGRIARINPEFRGVVYDWRIFVERSRSYPPAAYPLYRAVCPSWDNEARRPGRGTVFANSNPDLFREWLINASRETIRRIPDPDERLVFVNAWNEWAEGAHLEPDRRYGYAWLQATRDALAAADASPPAAPLVVVAHDAHPHGAQFLALAMARALKQDFHFDVEIVLLGKGRLKPEFEAVATVHDLSGHEPDGPEAGALARRLRKAGVRAAIVNTTVSARFGEALAGEGIRCVVLVHELAGIIRSHKLESSAQAAARYAHAIVFPAQQVADSFAQFAQWDPARTRIRPQGLYKRNRFRNRPEAARKALRERFGLAPSARIVLGVGYADQRKGIDLFVRAGLALAQADPDVVMMWVGHWDARMEQDVRKDLAASPHAGRFVLPGLDTDTDVFYAGADVYALTSREDPFPSVILESLDVGVPVVAFQGAGGFAGLVEEGCGVLVPREDTEALARAIGRLLGDREGARRMGAVGQERVRTDFGFSHYLFDLLELAGVGPRRVTAIVPNFNYGRYLAERLRSVAGQTHPLYELIVLDDASTDDSRQVIESFVADCRIDVRVVWNAANSGSVFRQWRDGVDRARGDFVWIAEADDLCAPTFLEGVLAAFDDPRVVMSYCESRQIGPDGTVMADSYREYVADLSADRWSRPYVADGREEIRRYLAVKNTVPNVSAVVLRRERLAEVLHEHFDRIRAFKVAGDWLTYVLALAGGGRIAFNPRPDNLHRRHGKSVTISSFDERQLREIVSMQQWIEREFQPDAGVRDTARRYAQHLYESFGLASPDHPRFDQNPAILAGTGLGP
jgi:SAM-dependent methyltransferase